MSLSDPDLIDYQCMEWAVEKRKISGVTLTIKLEPKERLGKLRSTLAAVREEGEGASYGISSQSFPEVHNKRSALINCCWQSMEAGRKEIMYMEYVWRGDRRSGRQGLSLVEIIRLLNDPIVAVPCRTKMDDKRYYDLLASAKADLERYLRGCKDETEDAA
jgi:hypothetical protein